MGNPLTKRTYYREPESAQGLRTRADELLEQGVISDELATAIYIAVDHQAQIDYDGIQEEYNDTDSDELRDLLRDAGVIIVLTEEQTRSVKYGV